MSEREVEIAQAGSVFLDRQGQLVTITPFPHSTDNGDYPDGYKLEFADGSNLTVDGPQTVLDYIDHLALTKLQ